MSEIRNDEYKAALRQARRIDPVGNDYQNAVLALLIIIAQRLPEQPVDH